MYGPLVTAGYVSASYLPMSVTFSQTCFGMIGTGFSSIEACGVLSLIVRSWPLAVTLAKFSTAGPLAVFAPSSVIILLNVQAASSAVIGWPSDHFASRILNVQVSPSGEVVQDSARSGLGCSVLESVTVR